MDAWHQTHLLIWTPEGGGYPQQWAVMAVQDPKVPGQWRAMRREDWPGEKARWEFNLSTRRWFRLGAILSMQGRKGAYQIERVENMTSPVGVKLLR
jgi:hypothetical protein